MSNITAEGLRVTIGSTLDIAEYLSSQCSCRYLLTCRLSRDKLENLFGIVQQCNGCNDHPTPTKLLVTVNALAFYGVAQPPKTGDCSPEVVISLVGHCNASLSQDKQNPINALDCLVDDGKLDDVEAVSDFLPPKDHSRCVTTAQAA